jgi:hypothetical protein
VWFSSYRRGVPYPPRPLPEFVGTAMSRPDPLVQARVEASVLLHYAGGRSLREIAELTDRSFLAARKILDKHGVRVVPVQAPLADEAAGLRRTAHQAAAAVARAARREDADVRCVRRVSKRPVAGNWSSCVMLSAAHRSSARARGHQGLVHTSE